MATIWSRVRERSTSPPPCANSLGAQFHTKLTNSLQACGSGYRSALIHLNVTRAHDIRRSCGRDGCRALRERILEILPVRRIEARGDPLMVSNLCGFTVLLENCAPEDAVNAGQRLRRAANEAVFRWHGHPFHLGAHAGVVELGPESLVATRRWMERARSACTAAEALGGTGVMLVRHNDHAWSEVERERAWHDHLWEVMA